MAHPDNDPTAAEGRAGATPDTDPGRAHPYESLYRGGTGDPAARPTPRLYEQALSRPDGTREGQFGWLYRPDDATSDQTQVNPVLSGPPSRGVPPSPESSDPPTPTGLPMQPGAALPSEPAEGETTRRGGYGWLIALLALLVVVAGGVGVGMYLSPPQAPTRRAATTDQPRASAPAKDPGSVAPSTDTNAAVTPAEAAVSCQAPPATDDAGNKVSYEPVQMFDGDPGTAWRCNGKGEGQTVIFTFAEEVTLTELGLINGYTKVDPASGNDRYGEYRRISEVRWTFPDGSAYEQELIDGVEKSQVLRIPETKADEITLTILKTTSPGSKLKTRNAVLISEATFTG